jgi:hypothetical protein
MRVKHYLVYLTAFLTLILHWICFLLACVCLKHISIFDTLYSLFVRNVLLERSCCKDFAACVIEILYAKALFVYLLLLVLYPFSSKIFLVYLSSFLILTRCGCFVLI